MERNWCGSHGPAIWNPKKTIRKEVAMSEEKQEVAVKEQESGRKHLMQHSTSPFDELEKMFDDLMQRRFFTPPWFPRFKMSEAGDISTSVDMFEEGDELIIKAEIPGMQKEDVSVDFSGDIITISGEKKSEERTERKDYYRLERSFGSFSRKLRLPVEVDLDKSSASFSNGVLEIRMPKIESEKKKVRKITVS